jgi:hypothetical protein
MYYHMRKGGKLGLMIFCDILVWENGHANIVTHFRKPLSGLLSSSDITRTGMDAVGSKHLGV